MKCKKGGTCPNPTACLMDSTCQFQPIMSIAEIEKTSSAKMRPELSEGKTISEQFRDRVMAKLAEGVPVTITSGGQKLYTYYPDGRIEDHYADAFKTGRR